MTEVPFQVVDDDLRKPRGEARRLFDFWPIAEQVIQGRTVEIELPFHPKDTFPGEHDDLVLNALRRYFERRAVRVAFRKVNRGERTYRVWAVT